MLSCVPEPTLLHLDLQPFDSVLRLEGPSDDDERHDRGDHGCLPLRRGPRDVNDFRAEPVLARDKLRLRFEGDVCVEALWIHTQ